MGKPHIKKAKVLFLILCVILWGYSFIQPVMAQEKFYYPYISISSNKHKNDNTDNRGGTLSTLKSKYKEFEENYEDISFQIMDKVLSPIGLRIITLIFLIIAFISLIRTRNPAIYVPFYILAWIFAYLGPHLKKFLFGG